MTKVKTVRKRVKDSKSDHINLSLVNRVNSIIILDIFMYYTLPNFYPIKYLQNSSNKHIFTSRMKDSVDPDQLASQKFFI